MSENIAILPKGTKVQIMGSTYTLLDNVKVDDNQTNLNNVLKAQEEFQNGVNISHGNGLKSSSNL
ncbi:hypothetical protein [Acinetobacter sp. IK40]|uniref:hypothetical protein n=1 Tax=Acinetobacter sp. IK40 TaxID=2928897 RepID=UPI002D1F5875|nr:hypothetical protein [Acinetobacter sp. IK40]MEB3790113.1 hypothetical protein [Acinetobacter sp. IK40]